MAFLIKGVITAHFNWEGKQPSASDKFINLVIGEINMSKHCKIKNVGQGSSEQLLGGEDFMIFKTASSHTGIKLLKGGGLSSGCGSIELESVVNPALMVAILFVKNVEKVSANDFSHVCSGRIVSGVM